MFLTSDEAAYFVINGDEYRECHPEFESLIRNYPLEFPAATQNFSNVFTENLIRDASDRRFDLIIEGAMRNPDVPLRTAALLREKGYKVSIAVIAAHPKITELSTYRRYLDKVQKYGHGRLADIGSHNAACVGLLTSVDLMYTNKSVDFIKIYSYMAEQLPAEYSLTSGKWSNPLPPSYSDKSSTPKANLESKHPETTC